MHGDLHTHSVYSDGSTQANRVAALAIRSGLSWLAVTDHDSMYSVVWAQNRPRRFKLQLIPATELTAFDTARGRRVHLLCYFPSVTDGLVLFCRGMAAERNRVAEMTILDLERMFPLFHGADVRSLCDGTETIFKTAFMRLLYEYGYTDGIYTDLYDKLFGEGGLARHDPAYRSVEEVLSVIHGAGGVAVLAHPSIYDSMDLAAELAAAGAIDGLEIDHPRNTPQDKEKLAALAERYDLIVTGGSDFHGICTKHPVQVGAGRTMEDQIQRMIDLALKKGGYVPERSVIKWQKTIEI